MKNNATKALVKARMIQGWSQAELANRAGLSMMVICRLENGGMPRPANLTRLARAYGIDIKEFVTLLMPD